MKSLLNTTILGFNKLNKIYLSPRQVHELYGISLSKIYWWVRERKITYSKIGKSVLIPQKEFERFLDNNTLILIDEDDYVIPEGIY